eukprot:gnl/TRDRNA2_/TRDRNA2_141396_c0_seq1.p1 gnl/TRDRNA2_/TRDRNA2_141396_c0~~gnl/TRDRNA2_/TRDRNA2_141396_c0_seq1.p1  ORF type:complete len:143 (-),score=10.37 gnl/TRDRNA2_/TRDRNA2_141396_c0_seq1:103-531(-)
MERVYLIMRRLRLPDEVINFVKEDRHEHWPEVLSHTNRHLLCLARAFITNPELMCIHKPTCQFGESTSHMVLSLLREFVVRKGLEQDEKAFAHRRCRTCIFTAQDLRDISEADTVVMVTTEGMRYVDDINTITSHHLCNMHH